jgi:uncharacterized phage protein gp47/JayE
VTAGGTIAGGTLTVSVEALAPGSIGNVPAGAVTLTAATEPGIFTVTNEEPITGGTDPETDEALRERLLAAYRGRGPGTVRDYEIWARAYSGVGRVTVIPLWDGPGTVLVIALTEDGDPVSGGTVTGLQALLDPVAGEGGGDAPIGPEVTVVTATEIDVDVTATVELETGYSVDGATGTVDLTDSISAAVTTYLESVEPGQEIVVRKIISAIVSIPGVHDVDVDDPAANVSLDSSPTAEIATLGTLALTEGAVP